MSENAHLAGRTVSTALALGALDFVICAGARNAPLVRDLLARPGLRLWNHFDERSASFFALGLTRTGRRPAAVVTTSGTAAAELLPAVVEAWYAGLPLILLTADRPLAYRGSGAPQTIEQAALFASFVDQSFDWSSSDDLPDEIVWSGRAPLHANVCFEDPADEEPVDAPPVRVICGSAELPTGGPRCPVTFPAVALVGELEECDRPPVIDFLRACPLPAWCEATSGLREEPELAACRLRTETDLSSRAVRTVIRFGGVPSARFWRDLEERSEVRVIHVTPSPFPGLARRENTARVPFSQLGEWAAELVRSGLDGATQQGSIDRPTGCAGSSGVKLEEVLARHPSSEPAAMRALSRVISEDAAVFLGNSLPIREWNLAADTTVTHPHCFANRGANGIDGELSTFLGVSRDFEESWGIFGDLTALYDLGALWIAPQLPPGRRRIVILNNGGGRIFSRLPALNRLPEEAMAMVENRHAISFRGLAQLWHWDYHEVDAAGVDRLDAADSSRAIIEVRIDQRDSEAFWGDWARK